MLLIFIACTSVLSFGMNILRNQQSNEYAKYSAPN